MTVNEMKKMLEGKSESDSILIRSMVNDSEAWLNVKEEMFFITQTPNTPKR